MSHESLHISRKPAWISHDDPDAPGLEYGQKCAEKPEKIGNIPRFCLATGTGTTWMIASRCVRRPYGREWTKKAESKRCVRKKTNHGHICLLVMCRGEEGGKGCFRLDQSEIRLISPSSTFQVYRHQYLISSIICSQLNATKNVEHDISRTSQHTCVYTRASGQSPELPTTTRTTAALVRKAPSQHQYSVHLRFPASARGRATV